jgi:hypothetical protein
LSTVIILLGPAFFVLPAASTVRVRGQCVGNLKTMLKTHVQNQKINNSNN